jgi:glycosyltransferase involved in cell wall biosynthesis
MGGVSAGAFELPAVEYRPRVCGKVLVIITEDWFALSHFVPLISELKSLAADVVVATRCSGQLHKIADLGVRTRAFDMRRGSLNVPALMQVRADLARIIDEERPDAVHAISMQTLVMTSLALPQARHRPSAIILHLTGLGYLGYSRSPVARVLRPFARTAIKRCMSENNAWLVAENSDDVSKMVVDGVAPPTRTAEIPGAGIGADSYPELPPPLNARPRAAFVGRMLLSKGLGVLVKAHDKLRARGVYIDLALYGNDDPESRQAIPRQTLLSWNGQAGITWYGRTNDIVGVWAAADIAVMPAIEGEGMPRAMLEAGACGRPLVVSDVPGCRQLVRHGVEGLVVPPGDPDALAAALGRLAADSGLRLQIGAAARKRVLLDYTEEAVRAKVREVYAKAFAAR